MAVELTLLKLDGGVLLVTVMTHALVGALAGIVVMLLVAASAVPPLEHSPTAWRLAPPLMICDSNGVQQQASTCAT